jgi:serine O-acetyltransferase
MRTLSSYIKAALERDPAARNWLEVILLYPGVHALIMHQISHWLYTHHLYFAARLISQISRFFTGIEIHPGASIGRGVFIDHGMGVVIGETAEVGDNVTIYQGVTLGGTGKETGKRHPTIEEGVMLAAGVKVLGSIRVGEYSKIGAGAVVVKDVPACSTVVGVPGRVVSRNGVRVRQVDLNQCDIPDPVAKIIESLSLKVTQLEENYRVIYSLSESISKDIEKLGESLK